jgi:4-hydroxythreonine-4-phosphate dehydrogenase
VSSRTPIIVTPGEPGGIGPEIALSAWRLLRSNRALAFTLLCDVNHLKVLSRRIGLDVPLASLDSLGGTADCFADALPVLHRPLGHPVKVGAFDTAHAAWVLSCIEEAVDRCLAGEAAAMVTCPIQKEALYASGFKHQGHTDFLASLARSRGHDATDIMMLVGGGLRAVPLTVHVPLKDVPRQLTQDAIVRQARIIVRELREKFAIASPRLAVTGLNPHAGENGTMGKEEVDIIMPAITALRAEGIVATGPLPADTAFTPDMRATYDAILCMYHDQALIPVKTLDFHGGVNVTLGLPFIRTSPDHGTALAIAGTGKAKPDSLVAAIELAARMAKGNGLATGD